MIQLPQCCDSAAMVRRRTALTCWFICLVYLRHRRPFGPRTSPAAVVLVIWGRACMREMRTGIHRAHWELPSVARAVLYVPRCLARVQYTAAAGLHVTTPEKNPGQAHCMRPMQRSRAVELAAEDTAPCTTKPHCYPAKKPTRLNSWRQLQSLPYLTSERYFTTVLPTSSLFLFQLPIVIHDGAPAETYCLRQLSYLNSRISGRTIPSINCLLPQAHPLRVHSGRPQS